jgi:hypothetical protein
MSHREVRQQVGAGRAVDGVGDRIQTVTGAKVEHRVAGMPTEQILDGSEALVRGELGKADESGVPPGKKQLQTR